ncbi:MAG: polysaccharide biosynthesis tyrosine autokinase [Ruminococcaceae bacterium]|nr:polysaccharide biosynthesis tyrosine autokinase [Oscillospiraceae bacterium]
MEQKNKKTDGDTPFLSFDPIVIIQDVLKKWLLIILIACIAGVGTYIKADMDYSPVYRCVTTFVVTTRGTSTTVYSNLSSTTSLASVFTELLNSSILRKNIMEEVGSEHYDAAIEASVVTETNLINVSVKSSNPRTAFLVSKAIIENHEKLTYQVVDGVSLEVLQNPKVPMSPINSANALSQAKKIMLYTALATVALLAVQSYFKNTVRSEAEAKEKLNCHVLGEIPHEEKYKTLDSRIRRKKTSILITNPITGFTFIETIRKLRHRVEQRLNGRKVLMVTSLLENEGKSTVSVNLALSLAKKHSKVLLIDCDLRKPACHSILGQTKFDSGLRDLLNGRAGLSDVLIKERKTGMYLILEKRGEKGTSDLVSSEKMKALLKWAKKEFDYVILDSPPMAVASDAEILAELTDASLMVVRQNVANAQALNKALSALDNAESKLLGCVLNNVYSMPFNITDNYGYGGYKGYGKYGRYKNYAYGKQEK